MFLMTRSAKKKQQQAIDMRNQMQPGSGVRTIGGMYATVKEVSEDTVLLDAGPGVELLFAKNSIGAVLTDDEYNRIVHGIEHDLKSDAALSPTTPPPSPRPMIRRRLRRRAGRFRQEGHGRRGRRG
ncbi:hypothetical protein SHIRM173S_09436 [Streptomyces hirsutus]